MTVALNTPTVNDLPPLKLTPSQYHNLTMQKGQFVPFTNHRKDIEEESWSQDALSSQLEDTFHMPSGLGSICIANSNSRFSSRSRSTYRPVSLKKEDFLPSCSVVFVPGISLQYDVHKPSFLHNLILKESGSNDRNAIVGNNGNQTYAVGSRFHPSCQCAKDSSGFICSTDGHETPPAFQVVSGETLINITSDNEVDYLMYTANAFRLHRYGLLAFGVTRDFIPTAFGKGAPSFFRKIAVHRTAKVFFNTKGFHSLPTFVSVLNNAILRANLPVHKGDPSGYGITVINHPLPDTNSISEQEKLAQGTDVVIAIFVITAMSFIPASFVLFLVTERYTKTKHLQMVSGVKPIIYWIGNYVWDFCNSVIPAIVCILILIMFDIHAYTSETNLPAVIVLFLVYGWSITPVMYPVSYIFEEPSTAYVFLIIMNLFIGITCLITDSVLKNLSATNANLNNAYDVLQTIFMLFPNYCLGQGLVDLSANDLNNLFFLKTGRAEEMKSPWAWNIIPKKLIAMAASGFVSFLITLWCERWTSKKFRQLRGLPLAPRNEDDDVELERKRVLSGAAVTDVLRLENLTKIYHTRKLGDCLAVDRLSVGIRDGECFGLLGMNGAGKTTVFALLTGDTLSTEGDAFLNGFSISNEFNCAKSFIGYCPQFDALYDELTGREHIKLYSSFRGIPSSEHSKVVEWALNKLNLVPYADRQAGTYSGGNRRKLSTALALIGNPSIIFLDEPSTGMDPHSRRFLWDVILNLIKNGHAIVLSSHSMEECEALCSRVAIMVNGRFCCLGSVQHLKNKFGGGYFIIVRIKGKKFDAVKEYFTSTFTDCILKEKHHNMLHYELKSASASLAYIFSCMEAALTYLPIEDYSVCQNTLDNVFVDFVKTYSGLSTDCMNENDDQHKENTIKPASECSPGTEMTEFISL